MRFDQFAEMADQMNPKRPAFRDALAASNAAREESRRLKPSNGLSFAKLCCWVSPLTTYPTCALLEALPTPLIVKTRLECPGSAGARDG